MADVQWRVEIGNGLTGTRVLGLAKSCFVRCHLHEGEWTTCRRTAEDWRPFARLDELQPQNQSWAAHRGHQLATAENARGLRLTRRKHGAASPRNNDTCFCKRFEHGAHVWLTTQRHTGARSAMARRGRLRRVVSHQATAPSRPLPVSMQGAGGRHTWIEV